MVLLLIMVLYLVGLLLVLLLRLLHFFLVLLLCSRNFFLVMLLIFLKLLLMVLLIFEIMLGIMLSCGLGEFRARCSTSPSTAGTNSSIAFVTMHSQVS